VRADFLAWLIESPGRQARRLGVTRQSIIKVWSAAFRQREGPATRVVQPGVPYSSMKIHDE
jgi:hypothetical protein